jgi:hypothetical protein
MSKRFKYLISSLAMMAGFVLLVSLPYESHLYGLLTGIALTVFCFWFGLGIIFEKDIYTRLMVVILPVGFFVGFGLFISLLPFNLLMMVVSCLIYGIVIYTLFLVDNVFLVALNYKTVPLYRSAYTVGLMILMIVTFLLFDSLYSFRLPYWINMMGVGVISWLMMVFHYWSVEIEMVDSKRKNLFIYTVLPAYLVSQLALIFSFWPVGIFKASLYLVFVIYLMCGLIQADMRERLFKKTWIKSVWMGIALIAGIIYMSRWGEF